MCGRYQLKTGESNSKMRRMIDLCNAAALPEHRIHREKDSEICPGDFAPALVMRDGKVLPASMQWGFAREQGGLVINARSEDVRLRAMFRNLADVGRCALLSTGYFEWRRGDRQKYLISGGEAVYLAGLYRMEDDGRLSFVVLTRGAVGDHARIHGRMPVTLNTRAEARRWLAGLVSLEELSRADNGYLRIEAIDREQLHMDFEFPDLD